MTVMNLFVTTHKKSSAVEVKINRILLEGYHNMTQSLCEDDPFKALLLFLKATSDFYNNLEAISLVINSKLSQTDATGHKILNLFQTYVYGSGRNNQGINQTEKGETVTIDNVYLGNAHKLPFETLNFWMHSNDVNARKLIELQAREFIDCYKILITYLKTLLKYLDIFV